MPLMRITAPHFVAGLDTDDRQNCAPIIKYLSYWRVEQIIEYCTSKGWKVEYIERRLTYD